MSYLGGFLGPRSSASGLGGSLGIGTSIAGLGGQVGSGQATATLLAQWKMNENGGTGSIWADSSGNGYTMNANPGGNSTTMPGYAVGAQNFNNSQRNGVLAAGSIAAFNFGASQAWSVSGWVNHSDNVSAQLIGILDSANGYNGWNVGFNGNELVAAMLSVGGTSGRIDVATNTGGTAVPFNTTVFVTVTYSGSGLSSGFTAYINGSPVAVTLTGTLTGSVSSSAVPTIASIPGNPFGNAIVGIMCDIRVYTGVLSASQISALFSAGPV